jgi:hypothetical protein
VTRQVTKRKLPANQNSNASGSNRPAMRRCISHSCGWLAVDKDGGGTRSTAGVKSFIIIFGIYVIHFSRKTCSQAPSKLVETLISTTIFTHFCLKMLTGKQVSI